MSSVRFFCVNGDGQVVQTGSCAATQLQYQQPPAGCRIEVGEASCGDYLDAHGAVVCIGPAPSDAHVFDYQQKCWVLDAERAWQQVRLQRDQLLASTDWLVIKAQEAGAALDPAWGAYRQALRDITQQSDPLAIRWPAPPET